MSRNAWTPEELEHVRQTGIAILDRSRTDKEFKDRLIQDPVATLTEAGLPQEAVGSFLRDSQLGETDQDVAGYDTICFFSICP